MSSILVIDDDDLVRQTVKSMLEVGGHQVATATDGDDGLRQFRQQSFDLVVCDIFMPNKDGAETIRELRSASGKAPIIAMSGTRPVDLGAREGGDFDYLEMARLLGATATIGKPFSVRALLALVDDCLAAGAAKACD